MASPVLNYLLLLVANLKPIANLDCCHRSSDRSMSMSSVRTLHNKVGYVELVRDLRGKAPKADEEQNDIEVICIDAEMFVVVNHIHQFHPGAAAVSHPGNLKPLSSRAFL